MNRARADTFEVCVGDDEPCASERSPELKRKRTTLTVGEKREVCMWKREHPRSTLHDVMLWCRINLGLDIGKSSVSRILQESDKWINTAPDAVNSMDSRNSLGVDMEKSLFTWLQDARSRGVYVSDAMIAEKARSLGKLLKMPDSFCYSRGWLHRFKSRHGICNSRPHGSSSPTPAGRKDASEELPRSTSHVQLQTVLADYTLNNIYYAQEMVFSYAALPMKGSTREKQRYKKQRLVVGLLYNLSGSHRWRPIVVGGTKRPHSFGTLFDPDIYCNYNYEPKVCLTASILVCHLKSLDENLCKEKRRAIMLIDEARTDALNDVYFCNLQVHFLPSDCVSDIATGNSSVIHGVKALYRRDLVLHSAMCKDAELQTEISVRWALRTLSQAWMSLPSQVILDSWGQTGLLPFQQLERTASDTCKSLVQELQKLLDIVYPRRAGAEAYIRVDDCDGVDEGLYTAFHEQPECIASILEPNHTDAWRGLHTLITYLEQEGDASTIRELAKLEKKLNLKILK
nr:tigger transposable element-derived protein 6-like [Dermacentor andersoni]